MSKELLEFTCPDCRGPMSRVTDGGPPAYRCLVGHTYSTRSLLEAHSETQERALWSAVLALEEAVNVAEEASKQLPALRDRLAGSAEEKQEQARKVRELVERLRPFPTD